MNDYEPAGTDELEETTDPVVIEILGFDPKDLEDT